jgi:hypothetical protein
MLEMVTGPLDRSQYEEPDDVALAALDFLTSDAPRRRYMVVPNQGEAALTISQALREAVQLNQGQPYSYDRDELVRMLDQILAAEQASSSSRPASRPAPEATRDLSLHEAITRGDVGTVRQMVEAGADLDVREPSGGSSPLITAAVFGQTEAARLLIEAGADVNLQNNEGSTALLTAAFFANPEIVELLLAAGADKTLRNYMGASAIDVVTAPFEEMRGIYDLVGAALAPAGLKLDYERIEATRPRIAEMLR